MVASLKLWVMREVVWILAFPKDPSNHHNHNTSSQTLTRGINSYLGDKFNRAICILLIITLVWLMHRTRMWGWTRVKNEPELNAIRLSLVEMDSILEVNHNKWRCSNSITKHRIVIISRWGTTRITHNWWRVHLLIIDLCNAIQGQWTAALLGIRHQQALAPARPPWVTKSGICSICSQFSSSRWKSKGTSSSKPRSIQSWSGRFSRLKWTQR